MTTLRNKVIRLAHAKPELRAQLLPLLKEAAYTYESYSKGLNLRGEIRKLEALASTPLEAYLPSEDSLMDKPGGYDKEFRKLKTQLEKIIALREQYAKDAGNL